jgi:hypothetical protein
MGAPLDTLGSRGANIHRVRAPGKRRICNGERQNGEGKGGGEGGEGGGRGGRGMKRRYGRKRRRRV